METVMGIWTPTKKSLLNGARSEGSGFIPTPLLEITFHLSGQVKAEQQADPMEVLCRWEDFVSAPKRVKVTSWLYHAEAGCAYTTCQWGYVPHFRKPATPTG